MDDFDAIQEGIMWRAGEEPDPWDADPYAEPYDEYDEDIYDEGYEPDTEDDWLEEYWEDRIGGHEDGGVYDA